IPLRRLRVPAELATSLAGPLADPCRLGSQRGVFDHLFDVAQPIGPLAVAFTGQRCRRTDPAASLLSAVFGPARTTGWIELFDQTSGSAATACLLSRSLLARCLLSRSLSIRCRLTRRLLFAG